MPWVRFIDPFDWRVKPGVTMAFKAGTVDTVPAPCASAAVRAGKARRIRAPRTNADAALLRGGGLTPEDL